MKKKLIFLLLLLNTLLVGAQSHDFSALSRSDSLLAKAYEWYPKYVTFLPTCQLDSVLTYAYTDVVPVIFEVNDTIIRENEQLKEIVHIIRKIKRDPRVKMAYIWVGGSASPEGPIDGNKILGESRGKALVEYIKRQTSTKNTEIRVENLWEDWTLLSHILRNRDVPNREKVIEIISHEKLREKRKMDIKGLDGGRTWRFLIREIFPGLRNARMVIVCTAEDIKEFKKDIPSLPEGNTVEEIHTTSSIEKESPVTPSEERFWAVKTNLLYLGALIANVGFEIELWRKWSLDLPVWYSPYDYTPTRKIRLLAAQPELRFWLDKAGKSHFFGLHTHIVGFNVAINDNGRYQDPNHALWGLGLSYGYATHLDKKKRWSLEFNIGGGFAEYDYDVYRNWANGPKFKSGDDFHLGITRAGISISYKFYKPRNK